MFLKVQAVNLLYQNQPECWSKNAEFSKVRLRNMHFNKFQGVSHISECPNLCCGVGRGQTLKDMDAKLSGIPGQIILDENNTSKGAETPKSTISIMEVN